MDFEDTPQEAAFRSEARAWLAEHVPEPGSPRYFLDLAHHPDPEREREYVRRAKGWQATMAEHGWACLSWPEEYGGRGASPVEAQIFEEESAAFGVGVTRGMFMAAISMCAHTLMHHGSEDQKRRFLEPIRTGEMIWTQLFSEPNAGSDVAGLRTRAVRDGDEYVVNGQKVWNSYAHVADWGILLARTNPDLPKHKGLSFFLVDMRAPGVEVRPLRQITGNAEFNETFFTEVRVPVAHRVGAEDEGWRVALTTLNSERGAVGALAAYSQIDEVVALATRTGAHEDPLVRQELARAYTRQEILRYLRLKVQTAVSRGQVPGPEGSIMKLIYGDHVGHLYELAVHILGPAGGLWEDDEFEHLRSRFVGQWGTKIGGGTPEIQRNTIGERVLGMPKEPKVDGDKPFRELLG
jgi:alkylation response protein AidB-like acyl-CoA dehydrogenase